MPTTTIYLADDEIEYLNDHHGNVSGFLRKLLNAYREGAFELPEGVEQ